MRPSKKNLVTLTLLLISALPPLTSVSAKEVQLKHLTSIYADEKGIGLKQPEGVALGKNAVVIVADTGAGRLLRYRLENNQALKPEVAELKQPQISYPLKVEINSKADIYVLDGKQRRIIQLTPEGEFRGYIEPRALPEPRPAVLRSFDIDADDNIYLLDILSEEVVVLNPEGAYTRRLVFPKNYGFISDLTVDNEGRILLVDSVNAKIFSASKYDMTFSPLTDRLKQYMRFPTSLATDRRGRIFLVDRNGSRVIILGQDGSFLSRQSALGWKEGYLNYPSQICIGDQGEIFIADTKNNRVQIFKIVE